MSDVTLTLSGDEYDQLRDVLEAGQDWVNRDYLTDPSKGGLTRVIRTDRLVRALRAMFGDGAIW